MESTILCSFCQSQAELVCHRCRDPYCSKTCQKIDWPQHKLFCFPMPTLVKPLSDITSSVQSEQGQQNPAIEVSLNSLSRPPSPCTKFRNLKLSTESDASLKKEISNGLLLGSKLNIATIELNDVINNSMSDNIASVDRSSINNNKPAYYKSNKIDVATIRKPGTLSQVMPIRPQRCVQERREPVEPPKQVSVEQPKQAPINPPKQVPVEPPKPATIEPPKPTTVEPKKPLTPEPPKALKVEAIPEAKIIESTPSVANSPAELKKPEPEPIEAQPQKTETGPWMKPFPMEENAFVDVIVQYVAEDNKTWVSLVKNDQANNNLLRDINKNIKNTSAPSASDINVNSLFLVPFEDIYYRGMVLQPVSSNGVVLVRLIDFGNEIDLPIGELKKPLPAMADHNAYAFPIKFEKPRNAEIGNKISIKKTVLDNDVMTVIVEGEISILTMKDFDTVPIRVGVNIDLVCLDFSNIGSGFISACIPDTNAIQFVEAVGPKLTAHCELSKDAYSPQLNELCLALFEDGQWYRAVTLKVIDSNMFEIMFIDYGNIIKVNSSSLRKMIDDFLHPCLTNQCFIKGFPKTPSKDDIQKMALYFNAHQTFQADTVEQDKNAYIINVTM